MAHDKNIRYDFNPGDIVRFTPAAYVVRAAPYGWANWTCVITGRGTGWKLKGLLPGQEFDEQEFFSAKELEFDPFLTEVYRNKP